MPTDLQNDWQTDLATHVPCADGLRWCVDNDIASQAEAFAKVTRPDWYCWLAQTYRVRLDHTALVTFAVDCAERVLPIYEARYPDDMRPRIAIETARRWTAGEASIGQVRAAKRPAAKAAYGAKREAEESDDLGPVSLRGAVESAAAHAVAKSAKSAKRAAGAPDVFKPYEIAWAASDASDACYAFAFAFAAFKGSDAEVCHAYAWAVAEAEQLWQVDQLRDLLAESPTPKTPGIGPGAA